MPSFTLFPSGLIPTPLLCSPLSLPVFPGLT